REHDIPPFGQRSVGGCPFAHWQPPALIPPSVCRERLVLQTVGFNGVGRAGSQQTALPGGDEIASSHSNVPPEVSRDVRIAMRASWTQAHNPNTYSIEATDIVLSSGNSASVCDVCRDPTSTAINCLPLTEYVIGGAVKPVPALKLQSGCSVLASNA